MELSEGRRWNNRKSQCCKDPPHLSNVYVHAFFISNSFFSTQRQCCLTFSWRSLWCCLISIASSYKTLSAWFFANSSMALLIKVLPIKKRVIQRNYVKIRYLEEISIKSDAKKMKDHQISKIIVSLYYCSLSINSLAMITQLDIDTYHIYLDIITSKFCRYSFIRIVWSWPKN